MSSCFLLFLRIWVKSRMIYSGKWQLRRNDGILKPLLPIPDRVRKLTQGNFTKYRPNK